MKVFTPNKHIHHWKEHTSISTIILR